MVRYQLKPASEAEKWEVWVLPCPSVPVTAGLFLCYTSAGLSLGSFRWDDKPHVAPSRRAAEKLWEACLDTWKDTKPDFRQCL